MDTTFSIQPTVHAVLAIPWPGTGLMKEPADHAAPTAWSAAPHLFVLIAIRPMRSTSSIPPTRPVTDVRPKAGSGSAGAGASPAANNAKFAHQQHPAPSASPSMGTTSSIPPTHPVKSVTPAAAFGWMEAGASHAAFNAKYALLLHHALHASRQMVTTCYSPRLVPAGCAVPATDFGST